MTKPPKPKQAKRVRCWLAKWPHGQHCAIYVDRVIAELKSALWGCTITPGHFVPDEAKASKKGRKR